MYDIKLAISGIGLVLAKFNICGYASTLWGATGLSIMSLGKTTFSITTLGKTTFSITTLGKMTSA